MNFTVATAVGILFVFLVAAVLIIIIIRLLRPKQTPSQPESPPLDPGALLRSHYDDLRVSLEIPASAMEVCLAGAAKGGAPAMRFYCWLRGGGLNFFPVWESLCAAGLTKDPERFAPELWRIPAESVVCHATQNGLPGRFTVLQYRVGADILSLAFSEDAARVFSALLPEKDSSRLLEEMYPKSSRNIQDIRESFVSLKELRGEDLITEDEYAAKKKEMLILM